MLPNQLEDLDVLDVLDLDVLDVLDLDVLDLFFNVLEAIKAVIPP